MRQVAMVAVVMVAVGLCVPVATAGTLHTDVFCAASGTPLGPLFLAGYAEVSDTGDLLVELRDVRPSVSWACEGNGLVLPNFVFAGGIRVDNCGVSDAQGVLHVKAPGFFAPFFPANEGVCIAPLVTLGPETGLGMVCFNGVGAVE